jgi:hypothetical protein
MGCKRNDAQTVTDEEETKTQVLVWDSIDSINKQVLLHSKNQHDITAH